MTKGTKFVIGTVFVILALLGVGTGYILDTGIGAPSQNTLTPTKTGKVIGLADTKTFKDSAIGTLENGGLDGEGTHKLIREGGPSQTAYLISSVVDLDQYAGKKVKVWGETVAAKKVSWLMDVGRLELLSE